MSMACEIKIAGFLACHSFARGASPLLLILFNSYYMYISLCENIDIPREYQMNTVWMRVDGNFTFSYAKIPLEHKSINGRL